MPFLQTSRAPVLPFLVVSFLLFLLLSPFHENNLSPYSHQLPLHYFTLRSHRTLPTSFYSTHTRPPIYVRKNENRVLCRLYHVCRLQNQHILLPSPMKPYSRFLRTQCGLTNPLVFSSHRSLKNLNQSFNHDWIAPYTPYHHLHQYILHYLPSFFSPLHVKLHSSHNFEKNTINTSCLLLSASPAHPLLSRCPTPPELTIPYPAVILDNQDISHPKQQQLKQQLSKTYRSTFKHQLKILDSEFIHSSSDTICFRSIISSPPGNFSNDSNDANIEFSTKTNVNRRSEHEGPSMFERLFKKIANRLARAFFNESPTPRGENGFGEQSNLGRIDESNASDFKYADDNRSLRKLLGDKSARGKGGKKNRTITERSSGNITGNMETLNGVGGNDEKKNTTITARSTANSTVGMGALSGKKSNTHKKNTTITGHSPTKSSANVNVLNANNTKSKNSNQVIAQDTASRTANVMEKGRLQDSERNPSQAETLTPFTGESFDDVDLENSSKDIFLPTFQFLLDYDPDT